MADDSILGETSGEEIVEERLGQALQAQEEHPRHLWDAKRKRFIPHVYLVGAPFPANPDESEIYISWRNRLGF